MNAATLARILVTQLTANGFAKAYYQDAKPVYSGIQSNTAAWN